MPIPHFLKIVEIGGVFSSCTCIFAATGPYLTAEWPDIFHTLGGGGSVENFHTFLFEGFPIEKAHNANKSCYAL